MSRPSRDPLTTDILVAGGGPVGLTLALELRRRGIDVVVVDRLSEPALYAKAVGIQPRTVELWEMAGMARRALDAATTLRGMLAYTNGTAGPRLDLQLPEEIPYRFAALPQYETERVLAESLAGLGTQVQRGTDFVGFVQDDAGVTSTVQVDGSKQTIRSRYLVGCDGAHSLVRKGLGLSFEGGAFAEEYMLGDVEVDWDVPEGYTVRSMHVTDDGITDDVLVCIPLPGHKRYRMSMLVAPDLAIGESAGDGIAHGLEGGRRPELHHIQAVLDRLSPEPATASNLRWSSVFRISHRLVDSYGRGRVFVAGDAAHIHPPTGAQGMNTGIQDAFNLGWKLALAAQDRAADGLLETYDAERHPVGEEVVGRTVRSARAGIGADETDIEMVMAREAQLLVGYPDSPIVGQEITEGGLPGGPVPGQRAPDAAPFTQDVVSYGIRLFDLFRHPGHTLLLWAGDSDAAEEQRRLSEAVEAQLGPSVHCHVVVEAGVPATLTGRVLRDARGTFAAAYGTAATRSAAYLIRPDGYVGYRTDSPGAAQILAQLRGTLTW